MEISQNVNRYESAENIQSPEETANEQGKILRLKQGYNPNSSSIGSLIFVIPVAMLSAAVAFGTVSGLIFSAFSKKRNAEAAEDEDASCAANEMESSGHNK